jgi:hypothetical protein
MLRPLGVPPQETGGDLMERVYFIYEKNGVAKILTMLRGTRIDARAALKRFAARTVKEVYLLDVVTREVVARLND